MFSLYVYKYVIGNDAKNKTFISDRGQQHHDHKNNEGNEGYA